MATPSAAAHPAYVSDIHQQPDSLAALLGTRPDRDALAVLDRLTSYSRVVLTGMGASLFALHPTYRRLAAAGVDVCLHETAELLGLADGVLTDDCLLWVLSQSGASAEVVALLGALPPRRITVLATTNDTGSPLAAASHAVLELHSGPEGTVGTRSYVNSLAALALARGHAMHVDARAALEAAPRAIDDYLVDSSAHVDELARLLPESTTFLLGRGDSLAAAWTGALIIKEAAHHPVEGMSVPQFRHGPLDMADDSVSVAVLAGADRDRERNQRMYDDLAGFGAHALWLSHRPDDGVAMPDLTGEALALAEIVPFQLLSVMLARRAGRVPGEFRQIGKVTRLL